MATLELMGVHEIADLFGVTRQRIDELARTTKAFPEPVAVLRCGRIWLRSDIEEYGKETGRL